MSKKVLIDKQALIDKLMKIPGIGSNSDALKTIKRFPSYEPQKIKVPEFVAEWIELCKEKADASSCLNGYYEIGNGTIVRPRGFSEVFYDWLADCDHMDDLVRAWLDGYEVEEEPKYFVELKTLGRSYFLIQNLTMFGEIHTQLNEARENPYAKKWKSTFTKKEIKSIDERYWAFAVPVEQVEV